MPDPADLPPLLNPRPRSIQLHGGFVPTPDDTSAIPHQTPAASAPPPHYRLTITSTDPQIRIEASTPAARRYALATLAQLRTQYGQRLPCLTIEDAPGFPTRGVMLDISRDRVPTMEHLFSLADTLAALKFNHLQLYTEHTFAYSGHEDVWRGWDPMTPEEYRTLDRYCQERGIELAANQNCFGHLASWLRHPRYAPLAETHGTWAFEYAGERFQRSGPFSLCPTDPRSLELVEDLLAQLLPCCSSNLVNIGCDETFDVGAGRSAEAVRQRGRTAVCLEFTRAICDIARRNGARPMYWADIAQHEPELAKELGDAIALIWNYEPEYPWADWARRLSEPTCVGRLSEPTPSPQTVWLCPGTSCWRSITGRTTERRHNLREAAQQGAATGAAGFLVTEWGDTGHHQQWPLTLHALAEAADTAWTGGRDGYDPRAAALHVFGDRTLGISEWLDELGDVDRPLRLLAGRVGADASPRVLRNASALFTDLHTALDPRDVDPRIIRGLQNAPAPAWAAALDRLHSLEADSRWQSAPLFADELRHTLDVAILAAERALRRRGAPSPRALSERLRQIRVDFSALWLRRSRPGGLESSLRHYDRILHELDGAAT